MSYFKRTIITDGTSTMDVNVDGSINTNSTIQNSHLDIRQDVVASPENSSQTNLASGETFTGSSVSTLGVVGLQVSLKTDQDCDVYVEQSPDGTNWDIVDLYEYKHASGGAGWTVQAINSYTRVRVTNIGIAATTYFRLQFVLCPTVEALPRSLTADGRLKVETHMLDEYGFQVENTPMGEIRTADVTKLVGSTFTGTTVDPNFWTVTNANGGTTTQANGQLTLATNTTPNGSTVVNSHIAGRYSAGNSMRYRAVVQLGDTGAVGNRRRWGVGWGATMPTITDGAFFSLDGTDFQMVLMKGGSESVITSGDFNGLYGNSYVPGTNVHTYEIYWTNSKVWFVIDDKLIHTVSATTTTWANTMTMYTGMDNVNSGGYDVNHNLYCRVMSLARLGPLGTQPRSKYQTGTTAANIMKYNAGNLNGIVVSGVAQNSVITLYDNTAATGTILWSSGAMGSQTQPFSLDFYKLPFSIGLTLAITGASSNVVVIYE